MRAGATGRERTREEGLFFFSSVLAESLLLAEADQCVY